MISQRLANKKVKEEADVVMEVDKEDEVGPELSLEAAWEKYRDKEMEEAVAEARQSWKRY